MRIQYRRQTFLLIIIFARSREYTRNLGKNSHRVYRVHIRDDIAIRVLVLEQKCTEIWLAATHHLLNSRNHRWIPDHDSFVETWE